MEKIIKYEELATMNSYYAIIQDILVICINDSLTIAEKRFEKSRCLEHWMKYQKMLHVFL